MAEWYESTGRIDYEGPTEGDGDRYGNGEKTIQLLGQNIIERRVDKDTGGTTAFILENGEEVPLDAAIQAIKDGESKGLIAQKGPFGMVVRTSPDGVDGNNIRDLPIANDDQ